MLNSPDCDLKYSDRRDSNLRFLLALVAGAFRVPPGDLQSRTRGRAEVAFARQAAMYLAHVSLGMSLSEVAMLFGRDRTTVAHACERIEERRTEAGIERLLSCLEAALFNAPTGDGAENVR